MKLLVGGCRVTSRDEGKVLSEGTRRYRRPIARASGAQKITQTINHYATGQSPARINPLGEEVHYVASGHGFCHIARDPYALEAGTAIYVPSGLPFFFENTAAEDLTVVSVCCPEDIASYLAEEDQGLDGGNGKARMTKDEMARLVSAHVRDAIARPLPRRMVHEREQEAIPTGNREFKLLIDKSFGCKRVTQFVGFIPQSRAPYHHHTYEEAIYILAGRGIVWVGDESCEFAPGTSIYLPVGVSHCLENPHPEPVRLLGVFYPSGSPAVRYDD
jgi:mannose-6-phosphate isomerase-like protein (cupin superfamily)